MTLTLRGTKGSALTYEELDENFEHILGNTFPTGTRILFQQTAAPTGWTKDTTHNNKALRIVSGSVGTGGSVGFTTAFASQAVSGSVGNTTLTTAQMPSHTHGNEGGGNFFRQGAGGPINGIASGGSFVGGIAVVGQTAAAGGGGAHNHSFTGTAIDLAVQYVDFIIATKD
jgi:hypothetical protein